nr:hypothetical protein [Blastococcus sp. TML/M2B]
MLQRRRGLVSRGVVHRAVGEVPVDQVDRALDEVLRHLRPAHLGQEEDGEGRGPGQGHGRRREDPARAAGVEAGQRDGAAALQLGDQALGDEEAREDEEDVDADEAAGQPGQARVVQDDEADGDRAQALDVGAEGVPAARRGRAGWNCRETGDPRRAALVQGLCSHRLPQQRCGRHSPCVIGSVRRV